MLNSPAKMVSSHQSKEPASKKEKPFVWIKSCKFCSQFLLSGSWHWSQSEDRQRAEPEQRPEPDLWRKPLKISTLQMILGKQTLAPPVERGSPIPREKHMLPRGATVLQPNWLYHYLLQLETVNESQVVTFQVKWNVFPLRLQEERWGKKALLEISS